MSARGQQPLGIDERSPGTDDEDRNGLRRVGAPTARPSDEAASPTTFYRTQVTVKPLNYILYMYNIFYILYLTRQWGGGPEAVWTPQTAPTGNVPLVPGLSNS